MVKKIKQWYPRDQPAGGHPQEREHEELQPEDGRPSR